MNLTGKDLEKSRSGDQNELAAYSNTALDNADIAQGSDEEVKSHASMDLERTASNKLSRITSRVTSRHIVDPGPPPGKTYLSRGYR